MVKYVSHQPLQAESQMYMVMAYIVMVYTSRRPDGYGLEVDCIVVMAYIVMAFW